MPSECSVCKEEKAEKEAIVEMPNEPDRSTPICTDCINRGFDYEDLFGEEMINDSIGVDVGYLDNQ